MKLGREYQIDKIETGPARNLGVGEPPSNYLGPANHHTMTEEIGPACRRSWRAAIFFITTNGPRKNLLKSQKTHKCAKPAKEPPKKTQYPYRPGNLFEKSLKSLRNERADGKTNQLKISTKKET